MPADPVRHRPFPRLPARVAALALVLALGACAGNVSRPVPEESRDTSGRHDGLWVAKVDTPGGQQTIERWQFKCGPLSFEWPFEVRDGVARINFEDGGETTVHEAFVARSGRFRLEMPLDVRARASGGSDSQISNGEVKLILEGDLGDAEPRGYYVEGIRDFLYRGCRQRVEYERRGA